MGWPITNKTTKTKKIQKKSFYTNEKQPSFKLFNRSHSIKNTTLKQYLRLNFLPTVFIVYILIAILLALSFTRCSLIMYPGNQPIINNIFPEPNAINVNPYPVISAFITHPDSERNPFLYFTLKMDIFINVTNADGGATSDHWSGVRNGLRSISTSTQNKIATFGKTYYWEISVSDRFNPPLVINYSFTLRDKFVVGETIGFTATLPDKNTIDLNWQKGQHATHSIIVAKQGNYPSDRTDGIEIYRGTGSSTTHFGLNAGETWYYCIWGHNEIDDVFSLECAQFFVTIPSNNPVIFSNENPINGTTDVSNSLTWSILIEDADSDSFDWTIEASNGQRSFANAAVNGVKTLSLSSLSFSTDYVVWVNATDSGSGISVREWFTFTTMFNYPPGVPTTFYPTNNLQNVDPKTLGEDGRIKAVVSDRNDDKLLTVDFYWGDGTLITTHSNLLSGQLASALVAPLQENTDYSWYINITDEYGATTRAPATGTWTFRTGEIRQTEPKASNNLWIIALVAIVVCLIAILWYYFYKKKKV